MTAQASTAPDSARTAARECWNFAACAAFAVLGFFLPFSSAGVATASAVLVGLSLLRPRSILSARPWAEPSMATGLVLLGYIAAHSIWMNGWERASLHAINQYQELLLAPVFLACFQDPRHRRVFIRALFLGAIALALAQWMALSDPGLGLALSSRRISTGFALAVCAFVALMRARTSRRAWPGRALAAFLAFTVLFAVDARTGHVVLVVLVSCAAWMHSRPRLRWVAALAAPLLVVVLAMASSAVESRLKETLAVSQSGPSAGPLTSTAIRLNMMHVAADLVRQYALTGAGFANYSAVHEQAARARYGQEPAVINDPSGWVRTRNPHNEYLMQLIGGGGGSLVLFLIWLLFPLRVAAGARTPVAGMLAGAVLAFATGCLFNSLLLDFVEGHFYIALLAWLLAEHRFAPADDAQAAGVHRVLVVATRQIGDVLLTTPLIRTARARWPRARIDVLGFEGTLGMLRGNPDIDNLVDVPARLGLAGGVRLLWQLWRSHDLALVADAGDRAHLIACVAARQRSGIVPPQGSSNWWKRRLLDHAVTSAGDQGDIHVAVEKVSLLAPWLNEARRPPVIIPPPAAALPADILAQLRPNAVALHVPSMWSYKQWPLDYFRAVASGLLAQGWQVVLTGSSGPHDQSCVAVMRELAPPPQLLDLCGRLDFNQLTGLFASMALYIGPDTSVSHLAAAAGVPVLAIFGPSNPLRWAPWPARPEARALFERSALAQSVGNVTVLQSDRHCVPCGRAGCDDHVHSRSECLTDIRPERVLLEALRILAGGDRQASAR